MEDDDPMEDMFSMTIENGGTLDVDTGTHLIIPNGMRATNNTGGTININGTVTNLSTIDNNGIINNNSGNTLINRGTLINGGTINNASNGRITNRGTIENIYGTINNNNGGKFESVQTISQMGGVIYGEVELISPSDDENKLGCNSGYGMIALLLAGLAGFGLTRKFRKA